jgi:ATP-binding cassette subfamily F protein uup
VVTSTLIFEGNGVIEEFVGGYQDWLQQRKSTTITKTDSIKIVGEEKIVPVKPKQKLSYKQQKELDELPKRIEQLEAEHSALQIETTQPDFYQQDAATIAKSMKQLEELTTELEKAYERWNELEQMTKP